MSIALSLATIAALGLALPRARLSDRLSRTLKLDQVIWDETGSTNLSARVSKELLWSMSGLSYGQEILRIDLAELERRIGAVPWIESVQIQKRLPSTLSVHYTTHQARFLGIHKGKTWFISSKGTWITPIDDGAWLDLPVYSGDESGVAAALVWTESLEKELQPFLLQVHEINLVGNKMTSLIEVKYASQALKVTVVGYSRPTLSDLSRLNRVVQYLIKNNILVSAIDLRPGKKVVVNVGKRP